MNFMGIGGFELIVVGLVAFLLFGAKGMRDGVKTVSKAMKQIRGQSGELQKMVEQAVAEEEDEERAQTAPPPVGAVARPTGALPGSATPDRATSTPAAGGGEAAADAGAVERARQAAAQMSDPGTDSAAAPGPSGGART